MPLTPGIYYVNIRVTSNDIELNYLSNIFMFNVLPRDFFGTGSNINFGQFNVDQKWI